jgi:Calcium binding
LNDSLFNNGKELVNMTRQAKDEAREERIHMEIIVDAHDSEEQVMGWYYYLDDTIHFPFSARCVALRPTSPLELDDQVEVVGIAPADECEHEMFVLIQRKKRQLAVPLMQLEGVRVDDETRQAIEDWHYWVNRGYEF